MADAVIGAVVDVALSKAISILEGQINLAWDFKNDLEKLRDSMNLTRAFLQDAERKQLDEPVKHWLGQLRDIAYKASDVFDKLAYEDLRSKVDSRKRTQVKDFFSVSRNPLAFTLRMAKKVKDINLSIKAINSQASDLGLQQRVPVSTPAYCIGGGGTHSHVDSSRVAGREADLQEVVDLCITSTTHQSLSLVSIVGMAGLGKTTLAKSVFNHDKIQNHFKKRIWVCVAEDFYVPRILKEMLQSLTGQPCEIANVDTLVRKIKEELKDEIFLLGLDDVWDESFENWESLRGSLLGILKGSKQSCILVTSRNERVALVRETPVECRHHLKGVKDEECWSIIKERAFGSSLVSSELEAIGRDIARRCKGVPLVATVIGGTMCNESDGHKWE